MIAQRSTVLLAKNPPLASLQGFITQLALALRRYLLSFHAVRVSVIFLF